MADGKPSLNRDTTMAATAKIGRDLIGKETLGDTRQITGILKKSQKEKSNLRKSTSIAKAVEEAKYVLGKDSKLADVDAPRTLRKRSSKPPPPVKVKKTAVKKAAKKPSLKRPGTMAVTAQEGAEFLSRP